MPSPLEEWALQLRPYASGDPEVEGRTISISVSRNQLPALPPAPLGTHLVLRNVGWAHATFSPSTHEQPPALITIVAADELRNLEFGGLRGTGRLQIALDLVHCSERISVRGILPAGFAVRNGQLRLGQIASTPTSASLEEASLTSASGVANWELNQLTLTGDISLENVNIWAARTLIEEVARTQGAAKISLGEVTGANGEIELVTVTPVSVQSLPDGSLVELGATTMNLGGDDVAVEARDLGFLGDGSIQLNLDVSGGRFTSPLGRSPLTIQLGSGRQLLDAVSPGESQRIQLELSAGSICSGHPETPIRLASVRVEGGAQLQDVDCYALGLADLLQLERCQRFHPWIPRRQWNWSPLTWFQQHPARTLEDDQIREEARDLSLRERAHYWATMTDILKTSHAPGWVQSEARYAAARSRQASTHDRREWLLLSLYWVAGFGERIVRPLIVLALLATGATLIDAGTVRPSLAPDDISATLEVWVRYLLAPLTFFRLEDIPGVKVEGVWPSVVLTVYRTMGIILIVFSLIATRRIVKAE